MEKTRILLIILIGFGLDAKLENHINKNEWDFIKHKFNIKPLKRIRNYDSKIKRVPVVVIPGIITGVYSNLNNQIILNKLVSYRDDFNSRLWSKRVKLLSIGTGLFHSWFIYKYINKYTKNNYQIEELKDLLAYWKIYKELCPLELHDFFQEAVDLYNRDIKEFNRLVPELLFILNNKIMEHEDYEE